MRGGFSAILIAILLIAVVAGIGIYAYDVGASQGAVDSVNLIPPATGAAPYMYYRPFFFHPFGFFGLLVPIFFIFLLFALIRAIFWGWGHHRHWDDGVPHRFEEWHKRAHEPKTTNQG
jgi:hypothetical protein